MTLCQMVAQNFYENAFVTAFKTIAASFLHTPYRFKAMNSFYVPSKIKTACCCKEGALLALKFVLTINFFLRWRFFTLYFHFLEIKV